MKKKTMILIGLDVGIHNLSLCKIQRDSNNVIENILDWKLLDCAPEKNVKKLKIEEAIELVIQTLDTIPEFFEDANILAIETQPVGRIATGNIKMKCVSHGIQAWSLIRHPETKVVFINPKNKLTREYCGELLHLPGGDAEVKTRYKQHKQMAVAACIAILETFQEWKSFFHEHRKKDDISDALLLAAVAERTKVRKRKKRGEKKSGDENKKQCSNSSPASVQE